MTRRSAPPAHSVLLLMRHGKSDWNAGAADDFSRPLNRRGEKSCKLMGNWLRKHALTPDCILSSSAVRARDTARLVADVAGIAAERITLDDRLYHAGVSTQLEVLRKHAPRTGSLMLVGHNPGMEELLEVLCHEAPDIPADGKLLPTAAIAVLQVPSLPDLQPGQARLDRLIRPRDLDE